MIHIEIDPDGYPTEESLEAMQAVGAAYSDYWAYIRDCLDAACDYFVSCGFGSARKRTICKLTTWRFATGGWSGCEEVLGRLPSIVKSVAWRSSHRGGLHWFGLDERG